MSPMNNFGCINVAEYVPVNCGYDVAKALQQLIDEHPNRTLYFPDGEYLLSKPIGRQTRHWSDWAGGALQRYPYARQ